MSDLRANFRLLFFFFRALFKQPLETIRRVSLIYIYINKKKIVKVKKLSNCKMVLDFNSHMDRSIFLSGLFGKYVLEDLTNFISKYLKNDSIVFDIGANSGFFSLFSSLIAKGGSIHAFEPAPRPYQNFSQSVKINNIKNIKVNNVCVGAKKGRVEFYVASHSDVSSLKVTPYQKKNKTILIEMITLEEYCKVNTVRKLDLIKIDVEGGERDILFSSKNILRKFKPLLVVEFSNLTAQVFDYHPNEVYDFLVKLGYNIYTYENKELVLQAKKDYYEEDLFCIYKS